MSWKDRLKQTLRRDNPETPAPLEAPSPAPELRAVPDATPPERGEVFDDLLAKLVELSEGELTPELIDPSGHMLDQGYISSLSAVTFIAHIEDHYGVRIEDMELLGALRSLEAIAAHVQQRR